MEDLGAKIREQRLKRSLTLKQLAEKTDLSVSFLSEIERSLAQPSMASLRKIAQAFGTSLLTFRSEERTDDPEGSFAYPQRSLGGNQSTIRSSRVVRAKHRKKISYPGRPGFYELLTPDLNRQLEVLYARMEPGFKSGPEPIVDPPGEKCLVILRGRLLFTVAGDENLLEKGDSISYPADSPLSFKVLGEETVEMILVITPPGF